MLPTILSRCAMVSFQVQDVQPTTPEFQEAKTLLLSLVRERPSYPKLFLALEKIGELMEQQDPAPLFTALMYAFRDLEFEGKGGQWQEPFEQVRVAVARNIKLTSCLEYFFLTL
jgi:hypothetical protein